MLVREIFLKIEKFVVSFQLEVKPLHICCWTCVYVCTHVHKLGSFCECHSCCLFPLTIRNFLVIK